MLETFIYDTLFSKSTFCGYSLDKHVKDKTASNVPVLCFNLKAGTLNIERLTI